MTALYTLFWVSTANLVTPGADIRLQENRDLTQAECQSRSDGMRIQWSGHFIAWCQPQ